MCGRFVLFTTAEQLLDAVGRLPADPAIAAVRAPQHTPPPRYNIAPTQMVATVRMDNSQALVEPARWGLLPGWKRDETGPTLFNARAETIAEKPSFRTAVRRAQRCLIPMDGYYEWHERQPYFVHRTDGQLLWAGGLWDTGTDRLSATIVTTAAPEPLRWLHHRTPLLLGPSSAARWLGPDPAEEVAALLAPAGAEVTDALATRPFTRAVGSVRNQGAWLLEDPADPVD